MLRFELSVAGINSVYDTVNFTQELQSKQEKQEHLRAFYQPSAAMSPPATSFAAGELSVGW